MRKVGISVLLFLSAVAYGQTINPNQIRPSGTNGYVLTTTAGATVWAPAGGGGTGCIPSGTGILQISNGSGGCSGTPSDYGITSANSFTFAPPTGNFDVVTALDDISFKAGSGTGTCATCDYSVLADRDVTEQAYTGDVNIQAGHTSSTTTSSLNLEGNEASLLADNGDLNIAQHGSSNVINMFSAGDTNIDATGHVALASVDITNPGSGSSALCINSSGQMGTFGCGGGSSVTWPTSTDLVISNSTNTPAGLAVVNGDCVVGSGGAWAAGSCAGTTGISGLTAGYIPLAGSSTTITANSHIDDGVTTAATLTASEPLAVTGAPGIIMAHASAASGVAGSVVYTVDPTNGYGEMNQNNAGLERIAGWNTANVFTANQTAPSWIASGSGAGSLVLTNGTAPSAVSSSVQLIAPATVTTGYNFAFPAAPPGVSTNQLVQCSGTSSAACSFTTGSFTTQLVTGTVSDFSFNGVHTSTGRIGCQGDASGTDLNFYCDTPTGGLNVFRTNAIPTLEVGIISGTYSGLSLNAAFTTSSIVGFFADTSGSDKSLYMNVPTGGDIVMKINNTTAFQISNGTAPTGGCSGLYLVFTTSDGHGTWCNGTTYVSKF